MTDIKDIANQLQQFFKELPIDAVYLYGSYGSDKADSLSDYDIGILFAKKLTKRQKWDLRLQLFSDLAKILHVNEDNIDVVDAEAVPVLLQFNIISGKVIYIKDSGHKVLFEAWVMARYHDEHYYLDRFYQSTIEKITKGVYFDRRISYT